MKRRILTLLSLIFAMVGILAVITACKPEEQVTPEPTVVEEYYYDAAGSEYLLTLFTENKFKLEISPDTVEGEYALEGESLKLTLGDGSVIDATVKNKVVNMTYKEKVYNFLLKVDYTVSFDTLGGSSVAAVKVRNGKTVAAPAAPTKGEDVFIDWYTDKECKNLYYFSQPVTADLTLYARFVEHIDPEFTVKFETGAGASEIDDVTTTGGKLFHLPTPVKEGSKFVGWYVSQFYSAQKLSYRYEEQSIEENITLYAVWDDGNPVVSVDENGIEVETGGVNDRFSIVITAPDGTTKEIASQFSSNPYDFASMAAGEYKVSVTVGDKTTVRYFNNKALARVSVFDVEESTVLFNGVEHAQKYLLSVVCGTENHNHTEINLGTNRSWSFKNCDMPAGGISFVVKAVADGYVTSESEPFDFLRLLDAVSGLSVDPATEVASWSAVAGAKSYYVTVLSGSKEVFSGDVGTQTSFELKSYDAGEYTVKVKPVARGWSSPSDATVTYTKDRLAAPTGVVCDGKTVKWTASKGADKYVVTADGKPFEVTGTSIELSEMALSGKSLYSVSVRAQAEGKTDSLESDAITLRVALGDIVYRQGVLRWDPVLNVSKYIVTVGDGEPVTVEGTSYEVTFTKAGDIKLSVSSVAEDETVSSPKEITVKVYEITFDIDRVGATEHPDPVYVADGDILSSRLPTAPKFTGYTFEAWYTAPKGMDGEGLRYDDVYFTDGQNRTLYAGWTANVHTITFDVGQYGNDDLRSIKVTIRFGERITLPVAVSKNDEYAFSGWNLDNDSTGTQIADFKGVMTSEYLVDADQTLYATYVEVFKFEEDALRNGFSVAKGLGLTGGMVTEARVPSTHNGKPVTRVLDFTSCISLEVLNLPDTVQLMTFGTEGNVFQGSAALREVNVYKTEYSADAVYSSDNGVLLYNNPATYMKEVRYFPIGKSGEYTVPDGVTVIPMGAFYGATKLTELNISYTVSQIQIGAFNECTALERINFLPTPAGISASTLTIGSVSDSADGAEAFINCTALKSIHLPARLSTIDVAAFSGLTSLTELTVEAGGTYSSVDGLLCKNYEGSANGKEIVFAPKGKELGVYTIPVGVVSVGEKAFYEHPLLTGIVFPGYVVNIAPDAFGHIIKLESIEFTGTANDFDLSIQNRAFYGGYRNDNGTDVDYNRKVTTLKLPANLVYLGAHAFGDYSYLTEVWVEADREEVEYCEGAFVRDAQGNESALSYVTTVHIGSACPAFSFPGVFGSKLSSIDIAEGNPYIRSIDNVVYDAKVENILFFPVDKGGDFVIPSTVKDIAPSTFTDRIGLTSVTIPASVERVGSAAFKGCYNLETVTFTAPSGEAADLVIEAEAFYNCSALKNITLPDRLVKLGTTVFCDCEEITSIHLPKNLAEIDQIEDRSGSYLDIFLRCDKLREVTVDPENTHYTAQNGVLYLLKEMKLSPTGEVVNRPYEVLYCSPGAEGTITVPGTVRYVRTYAFRNINRVTKIVFQDAVDIYDTEGVKDETEYTIQANALSGMNNDSEIYGRYNTSVEEIVLPKGLKKMAYRLIYGWQGLTSITIPNTVTSIEAGAFYQSINLAEIIFEEGSDPLTLEDGRSDSSSGEGSEYFGVFTYYFDSYGIGTSGALPLVSIKLPARTVKIGAYAFYYSPITNVTFGGNVDGLVVGNYAFAHCTDLVSGFCLPEGTKEIGEHAFQYAKLSEIKFPSTVEKIGTQAYAYLESPESLTKIVFPAGLKEIGDSAFDYSGGTKGTKYPIEEIDFSAAKGLTTIGFAAFRNLEQLTTVKFAEATDASPDLTICASAFVNDFALTSISLPANLVALGAKTPFGGSTSEGAVFQADRALQSVTFETFGSGENEGKSRLASISAQTFEKTGITSITFPESTANEIVLSAKLFSLCSKLTDVYLSASVHNISNVFTNCGSLQRITIAPNHGYYSEDDDFPILYNKDGSQVQFVYSAVKGVFEISGGTQIGVGAFKGQAEITKVIIPASVVEIGANAFADCINLEEVEFKQGSTLTQIGEAAFQNCYKLTKINLEACTHLTTLGTLHPASGSTAAYYNGEIFDGDSALKFSYKAPASLTTIGRCTFSNCGLTSIDLSATSITDFQDSTFEDATELTSVTFPTSLAFLGLKTFQRASKIESIDLSNTKVVHLSNVKDEVQTGLKSGKPDATGTYTALSLFNGCSALTTVRFPAGLRSIGYYAFNGANALENIYIGDRRNDFSTVQDFGPGALMGCGIKTMILPGSVAYKCQSGSYYYGVAYNCTRLTSVEFVGPQNLKEITRAMFYGCSSLTSFDFTKLTGLTTIGQQAFYGSGITTADMSKCTAATADFVKASGIFQNCTALTSVKLPATATTTGSSLFSNTGFTTVDLADFKQITTWGSSAFAQCAKLTEVKIPAALGGEPGANMFQKCLELKKVTFSDDYKQTLGNNMFDGCEKLDTVNFGKAQISKFGTYIFRNCTNLVTIDLSNTGVAALGDYMFLGCEKLETVTLPKELNHAGINTFQNCIGLRTIDFSETQIDRFSKGATTEVTTSTNTYTFDGCTNLTEVIFPEAGVTQIGAYTFRNCTNLASIDLSKVTKFGSYSFNGSGLTGDVVLSPELDVFGNYVFDGCKRISKFTGLEGGTDLGYFTQSGMLMLAPSSGTTATIVEVPSGVEADGDTLKLSGDYTFDYYAFKGFAAEGVTKLDLSGLTIQSIPARAFEDSSFEEIILPAGVTKLGVSIFEDSVNLKKVTIPAGVTVIPDNAFAGTAITEIILPATVTEISSHAFEDCVNLKSVTILGPITEIPNSAFSGAAITEFTVPATVTEISSYAFDRTTNLKSITIPAAVTTVSTNCFKNSGLQSVVFEGAPAIGTYIFSGCTSLESVDLGGITSLPGYAFEKCSSLTQIDLENITSIGTYAFQNAGIEQVTLPEELTTTGNYAFYGCADLQKLVVKNPSMQWGSYLFQGCSGLEDVTLPDGITSITQRAFKGCSSLTDIELPDTVTTIDTEAFSGCTNLKHFNVPAELTTIGTSAFENCVNLQGDIVFSDNFTKLGVTAFSGCTNISSITLSASVGSLNANTFTGWTAAQKINFRSSLFEVVASCGCSWLQSVNATITYGYQPEA